MRPTPLTPLFYDQYPGFSAYLQTILRAEGAIIPVPDTISDVSLNRCINPEALNREGEATVGLFSSGTTADPKAVLNSLSRLKLNAKHSARAFEVKPDSRLLFLAKPWHVAGLSWAMMAHSLNAPYRFIHTKKGDASVWAEQIREFRPDYVFTVPAVLKHLHQTDPHWFVPNIVYGGYALRKNGYTFIRDHCKTIYNGYGQTEAGGLISVYKRVASEPAADHEYLCCGLPIRGVQLKGEGIPGRPEEIYLQSDSAYTKGFYNTGDLGYFDDQGRVYITGRAGQN